MKFPITINVETACCLLMFQLPSMLTPLVVYCLNLPLATLVSPYCLSPSLGGYAFFMESGRYTPPSESKPVYSYVVPFLAEASATSEYH